MIVLDLLPLYILVVVEVDRLAIHLFINVFTEYSAIGRCPEDKQINRKWPLLRSTRKADVRNRTLQSKICTKQCGGKEEKVTLNSTVKLLMKAVFLCSAL